MRRNSAIKSEDGPILCSSDMLGASDLQTVNHGELSGFQYDLLTNDTGKLMVFVELAHNTLMHVLAFGDRSQLNELVQQSISRKWLASVQFEGDFPDYFRMYCSPDKQIELREFFNPKTMLQFVEFCRAYDFEIYDDTLFISEAQNANKQCSQTTLIEDVGMFLQENREVLERL